LIVDRVGKVIDLLIVHVGAFGGRQGIASFAREEGLSLSKLLGHGHEFSHDATNGPDIDGVAILSFEDDEFGGSVPSSGDMGSEVDLCRLLGHMRACMSRLADLLCLHLRVILFLLFIKIDSPCKSKIA
jgi:hypothetical protein